MTHHAQQRAHFLPFVHGIIPRDAYRPGGRPGQRRENPQERGLARPIGPKYPQARATLEFEVDASERGDTPKMFADPGQVHHGVGAHPALLHVSLTL